MDDLERGRYYLIDDDDYTAYEFVGLCQDLRDEELYYGFRCQESQVIILLRGDDIVNVEDIDVDRELN